MDAGPLAAPPPAPPALEEPPPARGVRQTLAPFPLTGADFDVDLTNGMRVPAPETVKLTNASILLLQITIGGHTDYLQPGESNAFPTGGVTTLHVHPISVTQPAG